MSIKQRATIEDLYNAPDGAKAELVNGEIVYMSPTGGLPVYAAGENLASLREYARRTAQGYAIGDAAGYVVNLPSRQSFSPDASYYIGKLTMRFIFGPHLFAAEVRSEGDYGRRAEAEIAAKRADYFAAGTQVVWDVDLLSEDVVRVYRAGAPYRPTIYRRGQVAEAEPALPGWSLPVDDLFLPEGD
jgi:Uma2 family endonuclease